MSVSSDDKEFNRIVAHARQNNPFYAEWLNEKEAVPILPRRVFYENNDRILNGYPVGGITSGSTGMPVRISLSRQRLAITRMLNARYVEWIGGPMPCSQIIYPRGGGEAELNISAPIEQQIEFLLQRHEKQGVATLVTYPTNAVMLAQAVLATGCDMSFMQRVGLIGENIDPGQRAEVQRAFPNALIWITYTSVEFGLIAGQCPFQPQFYHIMSDCFRVELLDDDDRACSAGQLGRVIITDFFNEWSPLIRYDIGDVAAFGQCPCGRNSFPAFSAVHGKVRGALKHRSGQRMMPFDLSIALHSLRGMKQFQVIQDELEHFIVRLAIDQPREKEITAAFEAHFGYRPRLSFEYHQFLPRGPGGKFHLSICHI